IYLSNPLATKGEVLSVSPTARDLLLKISKETGMPYREVAKRINTSMANGEGFLESVKILVEDQGLNPADYRLDSLEIVKEIRRILQEDYSQTLMISAVLGQLVESKEHERFPPPAFFTFLEILAEIEEAPRRMGSEPPKNVDEATTRIIELTTTLVSLICEWSETGVVGVAKDCPSSLHDLARSVFRKTKLLQSGMWACVSCGKIVDASETRALLCSECDSEISTSSSSFSENGDTKDRTGYGRTK
ncbi:MAG: hypothetical protein ACFFED_08195, partial [Candidatus Thorarchaeota archaeon]